MEMAKFKPLTGASESVSPCFRFRITLLLGSPSSEKYITYCILSWCQVVKYSLYYIEVVACQYITFFILLQHSFNVIIGRSPRCISIIWSFIASQFFSGHFQITIMIECTVMAFYCDCNSSSSVKLTWLQTRSQRWMERVCGQQGVGWL